MFVTVPVASVYVSISHFHHCSLYGECQYLPGVYSLLCMESSYSLASRVTARGASVK